ncbi:unnamed protein product [Mytilus edulis]|uniref:DDE Tnp4 domain-containing protein n=1 Tax=Mytilus edulis TaxID=6550 RepID=A0A8S3SI96_MYTED|nr:unnamed protein product [Mytilus edulis]
MAQSLGHRSKEKIKNICLYHFVENILTLVVIIDATEFYAIKKRGQITSQRTLEHQIARLYLTYGLNISDRSITERSGFIDLIEKIKWLTEVFLIKDLLLSKGATLNMPFTRPCKHGKGRCLTAKEIKESKSIASLRIHVERSIQRLKSYKFLSGVMPINSLSVANQALKVAGFFCNLMKPLVQKL